MPQKHFLALGIGILAASTGLAACNQGPREPEAPPRMSNDELDRTVTSRINSDAQLAVYNIDVDADADKNSVTLSGDVPTQSLRMRAVDAAKAAHANLVVEDKIDVKPGEVERKDYNDEMAQEARTRARESGETIGDSMDDAWLHTKIRAKLTSEGELPGGSVNVDVNNNVVTLRGSVETQAEKTKAAQLAQSTEGVKSVRNQLVVKPKS